MFQVIPTELRANPLYYRVYYVHLNTIFASIIPLISLVRKSKFSFPDVPLKNFCNILHSSQIYEADAFLQAFLYS